MQNREWYNNLKKSSLTPPNYLFGIVWPILYSLMGISFYKFINNSNCNLLCNGKKFFFIQLFLNLIWTTLFFKKKQIFYALIDLILIIYFTFLTINEFNKCDIQASNLLIPYLIWLLFAFYLNFYIFINN